MSNFIVANATHPFDLADGRVVDNGDTVELSDEEVGLDHNQSLIQAGLLIRVEPDKEEAGPEPTEAARQRASELGVNIAEVEGTGADGRVTVDDVQKHADARDENESEKED